MPNDRINPNVTAVDVHDATVSEQPINPHIQGPNVSRPATFPQPGESDPIVDMHARKLQRRENAVRAINERHFTRGGTSYIGLYGAPVGELKEVGEDTYEQEFQYGRITAKEHDINREEIYTADISVAAIKCYGTDDPGEFLGLVEGKDEPYLILVALSPGSAVVQTAKASKTWKSGVFPNIRKGSLFATDLPAIENMEFGMKGIRLQAILMDQEHGDPESVRAQIQEKADAVASDLKKAASLLVAGSDIEQAVNDADLDSAILDLIYRFSLNSLTEVLQDDIIDSKSMEFSADWLKTLQKGQGYEPSMVPYPGDQLPPHIKTNFPNVGHMDPFWIYSNGDASYKVFFRVQTRKITIA